MPKYKVGDVLVQIHPVIYTGKYTGELIDREVKYNYGTILFVSELIYEIEWDKFSPITDIKKTYRRAHNVKIIDGADKIRRATPAEIALFKGTGGL